jgi:hypothetical protein
MTTRQPFPIVGFLIGTTLVAAVVVGGVAVFWSDWTGESGNKLSDNFQYDLQKYQKIDPALIHFHPVAQLPLNMQSPRAIAVGLQDEIFVAGDKEILVFPPLPKNDGTESKTAASQPTTSPPVSLPEPQKIALEAAPYCLAVGNAEHLFSGRIYVGMIDHIETFSPEGIRIPDSRQNSDSPQGPAWQKLGYLTSITTTDQSIFVADAKAKTVWQFDTEGKLLGKIDKQVEAHGTHVFVVPSPYFAVAMSPDGLLRVANPGMHHIEAYTMDGRLELSWGQASNDRIEGFCGCCNPSYIAVMHDGRVVTSEKGIPRVKVYSADGRFESVVVGPETLSPTATAMVETREEHRLQPAPIAVDREGRVLVLDPAARCVRVYAENEK